MIDEFIHVRNSEKFPGMDNQKITESLLAVAAETFEVDRQQLSIDSDRENVVQWDSLGHVMLMLAVEDRFHTRLAVEEIDSFRSIREIRDCIQTRKLF